MRIYVAVTGTVFALIVVAHGARMVAEGPRLLREPSFVVTSLLAISLTIWSWRTFRKLKTSAPPP